MDAAALFVQPKLSPMQRSGSQLSAIINHVKFEYDDYKYTVYRCAAKMVALQKMFHTSKIPYRLVLAIIDRHQMYGNEMVPPFQLTTLLNDIYVACERLGHLPVAATASIAVSSKHIYQQNSVLANFFWDVFDPYRRHSISLLEIKITFLLLCRLYASDQLIAEFYNLLHDVKTKCVSKLNFEYFVNTVGKLLTYIGEQDAYGTHNIPIIMEQCFAKFQLGFGLTQQQFHSLWSTTETRFLIYANLIALIKRLEDTEQLVHENSCAACNKTKITGIRFKCRTCRHLSLCLRCFATGFTTNRHHKCGHRMYEVFSEDMPTKKISHYFAKLCGMFSSLSKHNDTDDGRGLCNTPDTNSFNDIELMTVGKQNAAAAVAYTHNNNNTNSTTTNCARTLIDCNGIAVADAVMKHEENTQNVTNERNYEYLQKIEPSLAGLNATTTNAINISDRLQALIDRLIKHNDKLEIQLSIIKMATHEEIFEFLSAHKIFMNEIINEMRNFTTISSKPLLYYQRASSTPFRKDMLMATPMASKTSTFAHRDGNLTHSIYGAEINRTFVEANRSDYSLKDVSVWFSKNSHRHSLPPLKPLPSVRETSDYDCVGDQTEMRNTEMFDFRLLLKKVKEILEDSYSDNRELAEATQNLENVLDSIIQMEESRRRSM